VTIPSKEYKVTYYVNNNVYRIRYVTEGEYHRYISCPTANNPFYWVSGWSEPYYAGTNEVVPNDHPIGFTMPSADVEIYAEYQTSVLPNPGLIPEKPTKTGELIIKKIVTAPAEFASPAFYTFYIKDADDELVETVEVPANGQISVAVKPGIYYIYEEKSEAEGYSLTVHCSKNENKVYVAAHATVEVTFENVYEKVLLELDDHFGYIVGYPDGTVRPEGDITRAEAATIFFRMLTDEGRATYWSTENAFTDVSKDDWFNNAVSTLANAGVLNGYEDGTFRPNETITRAELVKIAVSFYSTEASTSSAFSDTSDHWAEDIINAASDLGFIDGYEDGTFKPDQKMTRAETMKVINRALKRAPHKDALHNDMIRWTDNMDTSAWYYAEVQEATNSHTYVWQRNGFEAWVDIRAIRDWTALEKSWSDAYAK